MQMQLEQKNEEIWDVATGKDGQLHRSPSPTSSHVARLATSSWQSLISFKLYTIRIPTTYCHKTGLPASLQPHLNWSGVYSQALAQHLDLESTIKLYPPKV